MSFQWVKRRRSIYFHWDISAGKRFVLREKHEHILHHFLTTLVRSLFFIVLWITLLILSLREWISDDENVLENEEIRRAMMGKTNRMWPHIFNGFWPSGRFVCYHTQRESDGRIVLIRSDFLWNPSWWTIILLPIKHCFSLILLRVTPRECGAESERTLLIWQPVYSSL